MALKPHIIHLVGHTEAHHAATAEDVIEASKMAQRAISNALQGAPDMTTDPVIQVRVQELVNEAELTLQAIRSLAPSDVDDPLTDPATLARAITSGMLDAPQLKNNPYALGHIHTQFDERGACVISDPKSGRFLSEEERLSRLNL